ncbi:MAG: DUF4249 domain-containing protein, partial [Prevotellaceae bacterium]|nr:DUF4249 domain-containing protein [Prevotellaceae bacterium]
AVCLFNACVGDLPIDVDDADVAVVNCILTVDTVQNLSLSRAVKITENYYTSTEIKEAQVILQSNGQVIGEFERKGYGNWQLNYTPVPGTAYQLLVTLQDGTELTASTKMPYTLSFSPENEKNKHPTKNFRQWSFYAPCWIYHLAETNRPEDLVHPAPSRTARLAELIGTDHQLIDRFNEIGNVTEFVAAMPVYSYYIRIKPAELSTKEGIPFRLQFRSQYAFIYFLTASDEYDQYLKSSLQKMEVYQSEDDPVQWFDEYKVYSNINNGKGIFAAYNVDNIFYDGDTSYPF